MFGMIAGNILSFVGMATDSVSASRKTVRGILLMQSISQIVYGISAILLGAYSAAVQNVVNILRYSLAIRGRQRTYIQWILIALGLVLGFVFNNRGLWGTVPVLASFEYSLAVLYFSNNERALKLAFCISTFCYIVFSAVIWNIGGVISNIAVLLSTVGFLIRDWRASQT